LICGLPSNSDSEIGCVFDRTPNKKCEIVLGSYDRARGFLLPPDSSSNNIS